jgi:hypothetical protein
MVAVAWAMPWALDLIFAFMWVWTRKAKSRSREALRALRLGRGEVQQRVAFAFFSAGAAMGLAITLWWPLPLWASYSNKCAHSFFFRLHEE